MSGKNLTERILPMDQAIGKVVVTVLTAGVIAMCSILWNISMTLSEIQVDTKYMKISTKENTIGLHSLDHRVTKLEAREQIKN
jgi:hypothetical protein